MTRNGKRRREVAPGTAFAHAATPVTSEPLTPIVFQGTGGYLVTGPESRHVYCFSAHDPEQMIDARDTEAFLKTGLFRIGN